MESKAKMKPRKFKKEFKPKGFRNKSKLQEFELDADQVHKYARGAPKITNNNIETKFFRNKMSRNQKNYDFAIQQSARAEILLNEDDGYLVPDEGEDTTEFTQDDIKQNVDITSATKSFKLHLEQFGPYTANYTRNGRHLLMGGKKGHIAALDWMSKRLSCEFSVMEEIFAVKWLHLETLFAVAQKKWVHFYDNKGTEIHCVKRMFNVNQLEFLPYHFLLASGSNDGWLKWLDVSIGEIVAEFRSLDEKITLMKQNPANAVMCVGSSKGVVSMWTPTANQPLARVLCHPTPITSMAFNPAGDRLATSGLDRRIKLWDTRMFKEPLTEYQTKTPVNHIALSQKNVMAIALGNVCEIFRNTNLGKIHSINSYLRNIEEGPISSLEFVPFEDVLGIGSTKGFSSILVPGCGEPNFDALEQNPFRTKDQRKEHEVKALLEKIPAELITLDEAQIVGVDVDRLKEKMDAKPKVHVSCALHSALVIEITNFALILDSNVEGQGKEKEVWNPKAQSAANASGSLEATSPESSKD